LDLDGSLLERAHPRRELTLGSSSRRPLAGCDSVGFRQLPLDAPQSARELEGVMFGRGDASIQRVATVKRVHAIERVAAIQRVRLGVTLAAMIEPTVFSRDPKPALRVPLGLQQLGEPRPLFLGLLQTLLERRHVALQVSHRLLRRLGTAAERRVVRLAGPSRSPLGQEVAVALAAPALGKAAPRHVQPRGRRRPGRFSGRAARRRSPPCARRSAFFSHRDSRKVRRPSDGSGSRA
jgi:hypothetical protein